MRSGVRIRAVLPWILATCVTAVVAAHHSTSEFDYTQQVTIKGTVKEVQWTNPHSYIQLMVDGEGGKKIQWSVEIGSPSLNINMGWRKSSVKAGDVVTMNVAPARSGKPYGTLRVGHPIPHHSCNSDEKPAGRCETHTASRFVF